MNFGKYLCCLLFWIALPLQAVDEREEKAEEKPSRSLESAKYAVQVSAKVQKTPAQIALQWPKTDCLSHVIYRRPFGEKHWNATPAAVLKGDAVSFVDEMVKPGLQYEYRVDRFAAGYVGRSYICSGIELPLVEDRGGVLLLVEASVAPALADELGQLKRDLIGDGWQVIRKDVHRDDSVESVRKLIRKTYQESESKLQTVFLFGHIPVPYSGSINPDGHVNHLTAWPADLVYADVDGKWADKETHKTFKPENQNSAPDQLANIPGDRKYDRDAIAPNSLELEVGRVDLSDMPAFKLSETELLRRYLKKNHAFRQARVSTKARGLIDDNFGAFSGEAFGWGGWSNFATFFGAGKMDDVDWFTTLPKMPYLWAYGCGGGSHAKAGGVGNTDDFAAKGSMAVFTMLFGSYFGDWNHRDNFMRAPLAADGNALTCAWDGRPHWFFHSMALGKNIGYCALRTQANDFYGDYLGPDNTRLTISGENDDSEWDPNPIHVALMGDPTLRMHPVPPPTDFTSAKTEDGRLFTWKAPVGIKEASYLIYRASSMDGPFQRVTNEPIEETQFLVQAKSEPGMVFMVKSYVKQISASGSYFNASQGLLGN